MKNYTLFFFCMLTIICRGQNKKPNTNVSLEYITAPLDNSRKDLSFLDEIYNVAKSINPQSTIYPSHDTLLVIFDLPPFLTLTESMLKIYAQKYFDAFAMVMKKDSLKYRMMGIQVCRDAQYCVTAWYDLSENKYKTFSLEEKLTYYLQTNYWPNELGYSRLYNGKNSVILYYGIDTSYSFSQKPYLQAYSQSVAATVANLVYKSKSKDSKRHKELLMFFCCNGRLIYFWRLPINSEQMSHLYQIKFYRPGRK